MMSCMAALVHFDSTYGFVLLYCYFWDED